MESEFKEIDIYEKSITTDFRRFLWSKFLKAIHEYQLINEGDVICVCISGGKDSMILAKLFMCLKKFMTYKFEVKFLVMNPGYNKENLDMVMENIKKLNIPAEIKETNIFEIAYLQDKSPCFLCAKIFVSFISAGMFNFLIFSMTISKFSLL